MRSVWKSASAAVIASVAAGACQLVSGLDGLDANPNDGAGGAPTTSAQTASPASSGAGGGSGGSGGSGGGGGSAGGGGAGGEPNDLGCDLPVASACPTVLIADTGVPVDMLAIDKEYIYWGYRGTSIVSPFDGAIMKLKLNSPGAFPELAVQGIRPEDLVASDAQGYFIWTSHVAGASLSTISWAPPDAMGGYMSQSYPQPMAAFLSLVISTSSSTLVWARFNDMKISKVAFPPPSMGLPVDVAPIKSTPSELFVQGDFVYFHGMGQIHCAPVAGFNPCPLAEIKVANANGFGLEVTEKNVYWTNKVDGGDVRTSTVEELNTEKALVVAQAHPTYVTADSANVYWAVNGDEKCAGSNGAVRMKPFAMVDETLPGYTLASNIPCPSNFVRGAGNTEIYWGAGTKIYRMVSPAP